MEDVALGKDAPRRAFTTAVIYDPVYKEHFTGPGHPESPRRCDAVMEGIADSVSSEQYRVTAPRSATEDEVALCHVPEYMAAVRREIEAGAFCLSTGDTNVCERSFEVALKAAGGALVAVDEVIAGGAANAFCAVRPPGHHATRRRGMGFCVFNNVGIAARYAQKKHGLERVLIVDWDVHHGNGTQDIFYDDPSVFYFSAHQWPLYPGTGPAAEKGMGPGLGFTLNCPMAAGACGHDVLAAFKDRLVPAMKNFKPELIVISAGFDARAGDPVGGMMLDDEDYVDLTSLVLDLAEEYAKGRVVSVLEGGYDLRGLASAAGAHVACLVSFSG